MKDALLSVRIPADLAEALDKRAEARGVGRSMMVREAVASYLVSRPAPSPPHPMPVSAFLDAWRQAPRLSDAEAEAYVDDLRDARRTLPPLDDPWA
jgi:Ribbon-helix-helix protein, copG family